MKIHQIRKKFLDFFANKGHIIEPSSSLIPYNDKTLLFVNAGMVPFKDVFSGIEKRPYLRAATSQCCIRAGGKHNDLENVGYTARHHTFFEMLGNFSFGDYFKEEAISYAWEFLTKELNLPIDKFWVSVYEEDDEAERIWVEKIGFPKSRISRCGVKDNFWQMGDTGPCGPCSEIFYDYGEKIAGGPPGHADADGDRFVEIWNLVFTQFDRQNDGYLKPLDKPCVDTGMGLERLASIMQHKNNNYDIDIFQDLTKAIVNITAKKNNIKTSNPSVRVIADHIRSASFLIADGIFPNNEGRGYVLRRIIRRAIRHGYNLGIKDIFFYLLAPVLALQNKKIYPKIKDNLVLIENTLKNEEKKFAKTLSDGMAILEHEIYTNNKIISGELAFKLYDTYGFPPDLTNDIAREKGLTVDMVSFDNYMIKQQNKSRNASNFQVKNNTIIKGSTNFVGYDNLENNATIIAIIKDNEQIQSVENENAIIILDNSSFYAESGGQIGDSGKIIINDNIVFDVFDTQKQKTGVFEHHGFANGKIQINDKVIAKVDKNRRQNIKRNHSATHLLHAALREILGENVMQKGSLVDNDKLRFDFSYDNIVTQDDLDKIEEIVNERILENTATHIQITDLINAKKQGAIALFDEKYDNKVRVLTMGRDNFSVELCGGIHVKRLGDIGSFRIINETSVASGVRRIEAITANNAYQYDKNLQKNISSIAAMVKSKNVVAKIEQLLQEQKKLENTVDSLQKEVNSNLVYELLEKVKKIKEINLLNICIKHMQVKELRNLVDKLKDKLKTAIIVLASIENGKVFLIAGVTKNLTDKYHAGKILSSVAKKIDGNGGGRADMAQGGGNDVSKLNIALKSIEQLL